MQVYTFSLRIKGMRGFLECNPPPNIVEDKTENDLQNDLQKGQRKFEKGQKNFE